MPTVELMMEQSARALGVRTADRPNYSVETVSETEVWCIDQYGNRIQRICGAVRRTKDGDQHCMRLAGGGTVHQGIGRCSKHEGRGLAFARQYRAMTMEVGGLPPDHPFRKSVETTYTRNQRIDLELPTEELKALYTIQESRLQHYRERGYLDTDDTGVFDRTMDQIRRDAQAIADMKEKIHRMRLDQQVVTRDHLDMLFTHLQSMILRLCPNDELASLFLEELETIQFMAGGVVTFGHQSELPPAMRQRSLPRASGAAQDAEVVGEGDDDPRDD